MIVVWLFLAVPWFCLQFVTFSDHTHFFFFVLAISKNEDLIKNEGAKMDTLYMIFQKHKG